MCRVLVSGPVGYLQLEVDTFENTLLARVRGTYSVERGRLNLGPTAADIKDRSKNERRSQCHGTAGVSGQCGDSI
jgi:hypothetical protein